MSILVPKQIRKVYENVADLEICCIFACPFAKALTSCYIVCWVVNGQVGQAALGALLATPFFYFSQTNSIFINCFSRAEWIDLISQKFSFLSK